MKKFTFILCVLATGCSSSYLQAPLPNDKGYINVTNGNYVEQEAMWTQIIATNTKPKVLKGVPITDQAGCAHFLIGIANGKTQDIRVTQRFGASEAIKFLIWKYKNQEWKTTKHNPQAQPAVVKQFANFYREDKPIPKELVKSCNIKIRN